MKKRDEITIATITNAAKALVDTLATLRGTTDGVLDRLRNEELTADVAKDSDVIRALDEAACSISSAESALGTAIAFLRVALEGDILESVDAGARKRTPKKVIAATS